MLNLASFRKALPIFALSMILAPLASFDLPASAKPEPIIQTVPQAEAPYDFFMRQGYAAAKEKDYATAARYFRNALFESPGDRDALTAFWNAKDALRPQDEARSDAEITDYDRYMEIGYEATESGDYQTALINFRRALSEKPSDFYATQAIRNVQTYINRGQADVVAATPVVYANEQPYDRYMRLGYAAMQREDHWTAAQHFRNALSVRPDDRQATIAFWNAADVLNQGKRESQSPKPESAYDRWMRRGYDATEDKAYKKALYYFQQALADRPGDFYATQAIRNVSTYIN